MIAEGAEIGCDPPHPGDVANIQYTSGTTGSPKGVLLTHRNLVNNAAFTGAWTGVTRGDRVCMPLPLYHCAGCICGVLRNYFSKLTIRKGTTPGSMNC